MKRSGLALLAPAVVLAVLPMAWIPHFGGGAATEIATFTVRRQDFERRVRAEGHLKAANATPLALDTAVRQPFRLAWRAPDGLHVRAGDPVARFDPSEMEKMRDDARDELTTTGLKIEREHTESGAELANLERDTHMAELELSSARQLQKLDETVYSRQEILESEIDEELATERKEHAEEAEETRGELAHAEVDILEIERRRAREKIDEAQAGLAALEIVAPHDGIVVFQRDWRGNLPRVGDTVFSHNVVAEIPDLSELEAEVFVLEADAGGLAVGKPASVILEAHPEAPVAAEVARVDALAKPRWRGSPVQYFAVTLRLESTDPERMKPGQRVRAELLLDQRREALVIPRQAVFEQQGTRVVYRRRGRGFESVPVTLGSVGLGRVVVEAGLEEGDVVALTDPERPSEAQEPETGASPRMPEGQP